MNTIMKMFFVLASCLALASVAPAEEKTSQHQRRKPRLRSGARFATRSRTNGHPTGHPAQHAQHADVPAGHPSQHAQHAVVPAASITTYATCDVTAGTSQPRFNRMARQTRSDFRPGTSTSQPNPIRRSRARGSERTTRFRAVRIGKASITKPSGLTGPSGTTRVGGEAITTVSS